nr:MAG TPA: hypothetical protein [Bacteriophage sp.]
MKLLLILWTVAAYAAVYRLIKMEKAERELDDWEEGDGR